VTEALPDPATSAVVLVGVSAYRHMPKLPTVANNLTRLKEALTDRAIWGLPAKRCVTVPDPTKSDDLIDPVIDAAGQARDLLIVYYAGHGFVDRHGALRLTVVGSREERPHTAVPYNELREALLEHNRAQRRVIILDCCYSGRALGDMSGGPVTPLRTAAGVAGSYLLTSAASNVRALAPREEECTAFTGEIVRVLRSGIPGKDGGEPEPYLTLDMLYQDVKDSLGRRGRPKPQQQDSGQIGRRPFVHNLARSSPPSPLPGSRWRRCVVVVAAGAVAATAATSPLWWPGDGGGPTSDVCSPRASLLRFSDELDKAEFQGQRIYGLSSLALTDRSTALTLADKSPPLLYTLSLGEVTEGGGPEPRITAMKRLLREDGSAFGAEEFDGEAIALEEGGKSVLVASEAGPSIGRFSLETGRKTADFRVPEKFRIAPAGYGATNATFESLALTPDGRHFYVGLESPLSHDGTAQGRHLIRVLRYTGQPGGRYVKDAEFAYMTDSGLKLAELVPTEDGKGFLALERGFAEGQGNTVRIYETSFTALRDVTNVPSLATIASARNSPFAPKRQLVDVGKCPPSGAHQKAPQTNPLLDNAEGMALGPRLTQGKHKGRRVLYLVTDDNDRKDQTTRLYALAVAIP
jgi:hypothetical protein